jgi:hypothetical protein
MTQLPPHPSNADKVRAVEVLWEAKGLGVLFDLEADGASVLGRIRARFPDSLRAKAILRWPIPGRHHR